MWVGAMCFSPTLSNPAFQINTSFSKWHKQAKAVPVSDPDCTFSDSPAPSPPHLTDTLSDSAGYRQDTHSERQGGCDRSGRCAGSTVSFVNKIGSRSFKKILSKHETPSSSQFPPLYASPLHVPHLAPRRP